MTPIETAETKARELAGRFSKAFTAPFEKDIQELTSLFLKADERDGAIAWKSNEQQFLIKLATVLVISHHTNDDMIKSVEEIILQRDKVLDELKLAKEKAEAFDWLETGESSVNYQGEAVEPWTVILYPEGEPVVYHGITLLQAINQAKKEQAK